MFQEDEESQEEISTEEILASIRNILLEKQEAEANEEIFELTKDMLQKLPFNPDFNKIADDILQQYAALFAFEKNKQNKAPSENR
ncbi:MAG: hypothetical protein J5896_06390 [Alphaproteobacteria bacterium]|nr:hypothetical protein [Alphaproteobacteria bacterium]